MLLSYVILWKGWSRHVLSPDARPCLPTELVFFLNRGDIPGSPGTATLAPGAQFHTSCHRSISVVAYASKSFSCCLHRQSESSFAGNICTFHGTSVLRGLPLPRCPLQN